MKKTYDQYWNVRGKIEEEINELQIKESQMRDRWMDRMRSSTPFKKIENAIDRLQNKLEKLIDKGYSDFRVYTTGERSRDSRLDCNYVHG